MEPSTCEIELTRGKITVIDAADFHLVAQYSWHAKPGSRDGVFYAQGRTRGDAKSSRQIFMHQLILSEFSIRIDHRDRDGLNNRRGNLRLCTNQQNTFNAGGRGGSSRFKGVSWEQWTCRWKAGIMLDGKHTNLGRFDSEEEAARVYDAAAIVAFGEFAWLNFPAAKDAEKELVQA